MFKQSRFISFLLLFWWHFWWLCQESGHRFVYILSSLCFSFFYIYSSIKAIKREVVTETWDSSFLDTSIVYKKFDFRKKTFLYWKIHKNGRLKHCSSYLILWSKFHFWIFKFTIVKAVLDFVIIWRGLILATSCILILSMIW